MHRRAWPDGESFSARREPPPPGVFGSSGASPPRLTSAGQSVVFGWVRWHMSQAGVLCIKMH